MHSHRSTIACFLCGFRRCDLGVSAYRDPKANVSGAGKALPTKAE